MRNHLVICSSLSGNCLNCQSGIISFFLSHLRLRGFPAGGEYVHGRDYQTLGRLSAPALDALSLPRNADAYLCGPAAFMAEVSAALTGMGLDGAHVRTEIFGAAPAQTPGIAPAARPPHPPAGEPDGGPQVAFARSGLTARWAPGYGSLLELAEACDVPVRWSCRTGVPLRFAKARGLGNGSMIGEVK
jgi:hypothetical protein